MRVIEEVNESTIRALTQVYLDSKSSRDDKNVKTTSENKAYAKPFSKLAAFLCGTQVDPELYIDTCVYSNIGPASMTSTRAFNKYSEYLDKLSQRSTNTCKDMCTSVILVRRYINDYGLDDKSYMEKSLGKLPLIMHHLDVGILHPLVLMMMKGFSYRYSRLAQDYKNEIKLLISEVKFYPSPRETEKVRELLNEKK